MAEDRNGRSKRNLLAKEIISEGLEDLQKTRKKQYTSIDDMEALRFFFKKTWPFLRKKCIGLAA